MQYMYQGTRPAARHPDDLALPRVHLGLDDGLRASNIHIDPSLPGVLPSPHQPVSWTQPVQRFLEDRQKTVFFNAGPPRKSFLVTIPNIMPPRHGSPFSSHEPSSIYSDDNTPLTPNDNPVMPAIVECNSSLYFPVECVNPTDLWDIPFDELETGGHGYTTLQRGFSLQSHSSCFDVDFADAGPLFDPVKAMASPEEEIHDTIEAEIRTPNTGAATYHDLVEADKPQSTGDDSDYRPAGRKQSASKRTKNIPTPSRQPSKRVAASRSDERSSPKRRRVSVVQDRSKKTASKGNFSCPDCPQHSFKDEAGLQNHIKKQHTRPFACVFGFAGCDSTFASKNEWKRHVRSQHLLLSVWLCTQGSCGQRVSAVAADPLSSSPGSRKAQPSLPNGAIFNRKDLYTQHIRRMHLPPEVKKATKSQKKSSQSNNSNSSNSNNNSDPNTAATLKKWAEILSDMQVDAEQQRIHLPEHMTCPVPECGTVFEAIDAWDQRMEHVAQHMEHAAQGKERAVVCGGDGDTTLVDWASSRGVEVVKRVGSRWVLHNPLKAANDGASSSKGKKNSADAAVMQSLPPPLLAGDDDDDDDDDGEEDIEAEIEVLGQMGGDVDADGDFDDYM